MIPETQREAWRAIADALPRMQSAAWQYIAHYAGTEGVTRDELDRALGGGRPNVGYSRRLTELEARGVLRRGPVRACKVTGRQKVAWFPVFSLPSKRPTPKPSTREALTELHALVFNPKARAFPDAVLDNVRRIVDRALFR